MIEKSEKAAMETDRTFTTPAKGSLLMTKSSLRIGAAKHGGFVVSEDERGYDLTLFAGTLDDTLLYLRDALKPGGGLIPAARGID